MLWNEIKESTSDEDKPSKQVINNVTVSCIHNYILTIFIDAILQLRQLLQNYTILCI